MARTKKTPTPVKEDLKGTYKSVAIVHTGCYYVVRTSVIDGSTVAAYTDSHEMTLAEAQDKLKIEVVNLYWHY